MLKKFFGTVLADLKPSAESFALSTCRFPTLNENFSAVTFQVTTL